MRSGGFRSGGSGAAGGPLGFMPGRTFVTGHYYTGMMSASDGTGTITQNVEFAIRFEVGQAKTFDRIGLEITTGVALGTARLGIRQDSGVGTPGTLLLDAGTIDATTNAYAEITISQLLPPGRWWLTATGQGAVGIGCRARQLDTFIGQTVTTTYGAGSYIATGVTGALGATYTIAGVAAGAPKILMRAA